jgi:hypothetical protein
MRAYELRSGAGHKQTRSDQYCQHDEIREITTPGKSHKQRIRTEHKGDERDGVNRDRFPVMRRCNGERQCRDQVGLNRGTSRMHAGEESADAAVGTKIEESGKYRALPE